MPSDIFQKYAKFLKELYTNKRKKLKDDVGVARNVSALIKSEQVSTLIHPLPLLLLLHGGQNIPQPTSPSGPKHSTAHFTI
ncbi:hypothetical protein CR513_09227, partial [Mucuna pruriens]